MSVPVRAVGSAVDRPLQTFNQLCCMACRCCQQTIVLFNVVRVPCRLPHNPTWVEGVDPKPNPDPILGPQQNPLRPNVTQLLHNFDHKTA
jgi:hypothetical protein